VIFTGFSTFVPENLFSGVNRGDHLKNHLAQESKLSAER